MHIKVETAGACRKSVTVEVPAADVASEFGEVVNAFSKMASVPGFRPGRAPRDLIKKRYAKEIVQEVKERLIPRGYQEAVKQEKLETVAVLDVKEKQIEEGQPFAFTLILDVFPEFQVPAYKGIKLQSRKTEITDQDVDETIDNLRKQAGRFEDVTGRPAAQGDLVQVDYEGVVEGKGVEEVAPQAKGLGVNKDFWMIADEEQSFLPGFATGVLGSQIGDKKQILIDFPATFPEAALAGKKATYFVAVKAIRTRLPAALDQAFLEPLRVDSVEALRTRIREELKAMRENNEKRRLQSELIKHLLDNTALDVPESVVATETRNEVYDLVQASSYRGVSKDDIENRKEEIFDAAARTATEKVKVRYILRRIADAEKVEATDAELAERLIALSRQHRQPADKLRADLEKNGNLGKVREEVRLNKTLALLLDQAEVQVT